MLSNPFRGCRAWTRIVRCLRQSILGTLRALPVALYAQVTRDRHPGAEPHAREIGIATACD
jgi:hypothetical protein